MPGMMRGGKKKMMRGGAVSKPKKKMMRGGKVKGMMRGGMARKGFMAGGKVDGCNPAVQMSGIKQGTTY